VKVARRGGPPCSPTCWPIRNARGKSGPWPKLPWRPTRPCALGTTPGPTTVASETTVVLLPDGHHRTTLLRRRPRRFRRPGTGACGGARGKEEGAGVRSSPIACGRRGRGCLKGAG
jgi:hypothetical protein